MTWNHEDEDDLAFGGFITLSSPFEETLEALILLFEMLLVILDVIGHFGCYPRPIHLVNLILDPYFMELVRKTIWVSSIKRQIAFHFSVSAL
jgi:hypothetical protein